MSDDVPNLRGGIPKWFAWLFGVFLTIGMFVAPAIASLIKDAGAAGRLDLLAAKLNEATTQIAVMKITQELKTRDDEKFQHRVEDALRELTTRKK